MGYIQSFNRYETKYLLTAEQKATFLDEAGSLLERDKYGQYSICNIYLDTEDFYFIRHSLDRPMYKEKMRIRSYGNADINDKVFFEIKKKYNGIVYKRRITISLKEAEDYIQHGITPPSLEGYHANQIFSEIDHLMNKYSPSPKLYLAYDREAFSFINDRDLRITFDCNIRGRWDDLTLANDLNTSLLDTGITDYSLMEIKSSGAIPLEICTVLSKHKIHPTSFSKYGRIFVERTKMITSGG